MSDVMPSSRPRHHPAARHTRWAPPDGGLGASPASSLCQFAATDATVVGRRRSAWRRRMFYAVSEFGGVEDGAGHVMAQRSGVVLTLLAVLVGLAALHPLSSAYPPPASGAASPQVASSTSVSESAGASAGHAADCPERHADAHPAPLAPGRDSEQGPEPDAVIAPALDRSPPAGPPSAPAVAPDGSVPSGARLLIGLCISRT